MFLEHFKQYLKCLQLLRCFKTIPTNSRMFAIVYMLLKHFKQRLESLSSNRRREYHTGNKVFPFLTTIYTFISIQQYTKGRITSCFKYNFWWASVYYEKPQTHYVYCFELNEAPLFTFQAYAFSMHLNDSAPKS